MSRVRNAYGKGSSGFDILYGFMGFCQIEGYGPSFLHGSPGGIHNVDTAVWIVGGHHQYRHWEDSFRYIQLLSHVAYLASFIGLTGSVFMLTIIAISGDKTSTIIYERYYPMRK